MTSKPVSVLVVGAGPVGLAAALSLAQNGVAIRVIEKQSGIPSGQRGAGIAPRTQEVFKLLGVLDDIRKQGGDRFDVQHYDSEGKPSGTHSMFPTNKPTPEVPYPNYWTLGQDHTSAILCDHLKKLGISVDFSTELVGLQQDDTGVTTTLKVRTAAGEQEEDLRASFVLGTDGGRGITRKLAGIPFLGESRDDIRALIWDVELSGLDTEYWHMFRDEAGTGVVLRPIPEDVNIFAVSTFGENLDSIDIVKAGDDIEYIQEIIRKISKNNNIVIKKVVTPLSDWRLNERMVDKFHSGRVFLAGDAAHVHSPAGGQGLNSGMMDAMNLGWKLGLVSKGLAPPSLLDTYDEERLPVIQEMLNITSELLRANTTNFARGGAGLSERPQKMLQLGVHYRWSTIVRDELDAGGSALEGSVTESRSAYGSGDTDRVHAGDRGPDAPGLVDAQTGASRRLFDIFAGTRHTVLVFDSALAGDVQAAILGRCPKDAARVVVILPPAGSNTDVKFEGEGRVFADSQGHANRVYGTDSGVKVVIVRPDGVVGGLLKGSEGVSEYFSKIFTEF